MIAKQIQQARANLKPSNVDMMLFLNAIYITCFKILAYDLYIMFYF